MKLLVSYDGRGVFNELTEEDIQEHLVVKRGILRVWYDKKHHHSLYKVRYHKLHEKTSASGVWVEADAIQIHKFSTLEFL